MGGASRLPGLDCSTQQAMDPNEARDFWQTVVDAGDKLGPVRRAPAIERDRQQGIQRIEQIVQTLQDVATDIDLLLTVAGEQVLDGDSAELRFIIGCNYDADAIEAVQQLMASAPER